MSTNILELCEAGRAQDVMREMRVRSLWSPYYLEKVVLGYTKLTDKLHNTDLELFVQRLCAGHNKQWIEWSRGFYKTTCFTIGCAIWFALPWSDEDSEYAIERLGLPEDEWFARLQLHDRNCTQLLAFETIDNAKKKVGQVKWHYEENQLFRALFPETAYDGSETPWNNECIRLRRDGYAQRVLEGSFEAIGVGGALQSRHYTRVWEDDLVGKKARDSQVEMSKTIEWHGLLHGAFEDATRQQRFGVSNCWGFSDLNAYIKANEPEFVFYTRSAAEINSETGEEEAIFPVDGEGQEAFTLEALARIRSTMTRIDYACQYMNRPIAPGDQEVDITRVHSYRVESSGLIMCSCGAKWLPSQLHRYLHFDPYNARGVASTSCPALVAIGCAPDKHVFLLDVYVGKGDYSKVYDHIFRLNDLWRPQLFTFEDVGHQNMVAFYIRKAQDTLEFAEAKHRRFRRIEGVGTHGVPKETRIREALFPLFESGKFSIRLPKHQMLLDMCETFPHRMPGHDYDLLDAIEDGVSFWRYPESEDAKVNAEEAEDDYSRQLGKPYSQMEVRGAA